jgi:hypothetical protein
MRRVFCCCRESSIAVLAFARGFGFVTVPVINRFSRVPRAATGGTLRHFPQSEVSRLLFSLVRMCRCVSLANANRPRKWWSGFQQQQHAVGFFYQPHFVCQMIQQHHSTNVAALLRHPQRTHQTRCTFSVVDNGRQCPSVFGCLVGWLTVRTFPLQLMLLSSPLSFPACVCLFQQTRPRVFLFRSTS